MDVKVAGRVPEVRLNQPEHVDKAREDHPARQPDHFFLIALQIAREQQGEGNQPVGNKVQRADIPAAAVDAVQVPGNLVRNVAGPDNQELGKAEIDVEHHEGKSELAQVMLLGNTQQRLHRLVAGEQNDNEYAKCKHRIALPHKEL